MSKGDVFSNWVSRNGELLLCCGILAADESGTVTETERRFVELMNQHIQSQQYGAVTDRTLDRGREGGHQVVRQITAPAEQDNPGRNRMSVLLHSAGGARPISRGYGGRYE